MSDSINATVEPKPGIRWGRIAAWVGMFALLALVAVGLFVTSSGPVQAGKAPDFTLTTFDGQTYNLKDLRGQVVVVNFWASWCKPCEQEAAALLGIPNNITQAALLPVAYFKGDDFKPAHRTPARDVTHWDQW